MHWIWFFKNCAWIILLYATFDRMNGNVFKFTQLSAKMLRWIINFIDIFFVATWFSSFFLFFFGNNSLWGESKFIDHCCQATVLSTELFSSTTSECVWARASACIHAHKICVWKHFIRYNKHFCWLDPSHWMAFYLWIGYEMRIHIHNCWGAMAKWINSFFVSSLRLNTQIELCA